jgi:hypothetical protein
MGGNYSVSLEDDDGQYAGNKTGRGQALTLTVTDQTGAVVDLSAATLGLAVKKDKSDPATP